LFNRFDSWLSELLQKKRELKSDNNCILQSQNVKRFAFSTSVDDSKRKEIHFRFSSRLLVNGPSEKDWDVEFGLASGFPQTANKDSFGCVGLRDANR
jgi:hypothetical protein